MTKHIPKNHTISMVVAKSILRLFFVLMVIILAFYASQDRSKLENTTVVFQNKWLIIFPVLLFLTFLGFLIAVLKNKYQRTELNWLFSLNGLFVLVYIGLLFSRIYPLL